MTDQKHDPDVSIDVQAALGEKPRRAYRRPELVQYGALQEVTRGYIQTRSCRTGCLLAG